jgi:hypothetical protein
MRRDLGITRRRGITIRSAVASFTTGDLQVNLIDTPGMPAAAGTRVPAGSTRQRVCRKLAGSYPGWMNLEFSGEMWVWKGPAPWHFITVPDEECGELEAASALVSYGWGMIPVTARIGGTGWKTSLFPKDGRYIVPVKARVRQAEGLEAGDMVTVRLAVHI